MFWHKNYGVALTCVWWPFCSFLLKWCPFELYTRREKMAPANSKQDIHRNRTCSPNVFLHSFSGLCLYQYFYNLMVFYLKIYIYLVENQLASKDICGNIGHCSNNYRRLHSLTQFQTFTDILFISMYEEVCMYICVYLKICIYKIRVIMLSQNFLASLLTLF